MKDLLEYINNKTNNAYQYVKLVGVVYDKISNKTVFRFVYEHDKTFKATDKQLFFDLINEFYNGTIDIDVKVKRDYIDEEVVTDIVYKYMAELASIKQDISKNNISVAIKDNFVEVNVKVSRPVYEYLLSKDFATALGEYLNNSSFSTFEVKLDIDNDVKYSQALAETTEMAMQDFSTIIQPKTIKINVKQTAGSSVDMLELSEAKEALDLSTVFTPMQNCKIAGNLHSFYEKTFQSKRPDKSGNYPIKTYYTWTLNYNGANVQCVYFAPVNSGKLQLEENAQMVVKGSFEEYNGRLNFKVKSFGHCEIIESEVIDEKVKKVNDNYLYVKPEKVENRAQYNFFEVEAEPNAFLAQNDVVVFDTETTGLDYKTNEIIEIGAVKLHNGEIVESFSTFVKPKLSIPSEITRLTGINDGMVANAYSINQVIPDFYKFCYGCVLVGYNIDFDYRFINAAAVKVGYKFTNRQLDCMYLARKEVKGAKNFTLSSICKRLGVSLEGAHRAINDARATAEVLKLISDNVSPK